MFSLQELDELQLEKLFFLPKSVKIRKGLEQTLVRQIKQSFLAQVSKPLSKLLEAELFPNTSSLSELLTAMKQFSQILEAIQEEEKANLLGEQAEEALDQDPELKRQWEVIKKKYADFQQEYLRFKDQFSLSFAELKTALEQNTPPINLDNLNTKPFSKWSEAQQKTFDTLFTKLVTQRLRNKVNQAKTLTEGVGKLLSQPLLPFNVLTAKYPTDYEQLRTFAQQKKPELAARIAALEKKANDVDKNDENTPSELDALSRELDECYREAYLSSIEQQDPKLAEALKLLYEHNFDYTSLETAPDLKQYFFSQLAEMRFEQMKKDQTLKLFGQNEEHFKDFWLSLFDFSHEEISINGLNFKIKKELLSQPNPDLKRLSEWEHPHELPLKISLSGINAAGLSGKDREKFDQLFLKHATEKNARAGNYDEIQLSGNELGKMFLLFLMGSPTALEELDPDDLARRNREALEQEPEEQNEENRLRRDLEQEDADEEDPDSEEKIQTPEMKRKAFLEAWKSMKGEKSEAEDGGFKPGVEIYFALGESKLPPHTDPGKEWGKFRITDVDWSQCTFKARMYGTELKLPSPDEGKEKTFAFEHFKDLFLENKHFSNDGKPFKLLTPSQDIEKSYKNLLNMGACEENLFKNAFFENGKLMLTELNEEGKEKTEAVKYFGSTNNSNDKDNVLYEIQRGPNNTVTVKSSHFFDNKGNPRRYEKKMSIPDFLLFLNEKKLTPKTESIAQKEKEKIKEIESYAHKNLSWISIHSLVSSVKNIWKKINEGLDNYQKEQDEACLNWLTQDMGIYNLLNKGLGWLAPSL